MQSVSLNVFCYIMKPDCTNMGHYSPCEDFLIVVVGFMNSHRHEAKRCTDAYVLITKQEPRAQETHICKTFIWIRRNGGRGEVGENDRMNAKRWGHSPLAIDEERDREWMMGERDDRRRKRWLLTHPYPGSWHSLSLLNRGALKQMKWTISAFLCNTWLLLIYKHY